MYMTKRGTYRAVKQSMLTFSTFERVVESKVGYKLKRCAPTRLAKMKMMLKYRVELNMVNQ
jgi:hypothetical protein